MPDPSPTLDRVGADARQVIADARWYEARLECDPVEFYRCLEAAQPDAVVMFHHFYEPWHRTGPVARLLIVSERVEDVLDHLSTWTSVVEVVPWDREQDDRKLYGEDWFPYAMQFFAASSAFVGHPDAERMTSKLIHCVLNARRLTRRAEVRWALGFAWRSATIEPRLWWCARRTGRRWWEK